MRPEKSFLSIRLTEPVVSLRSTPEPAPVHHDGEVPSPAIVRGLLTLKLARATKISGIELELQAKATTHYIQSAGPSRINVTERYKVHSASIVVFKAGPAQERRRAASTRPRVQFLDSHFESNATHLGGVGDAYWHVLSEPVARSVSLDPLWDRRRLSSNEVEIDYSGFPQRAGLSTDPAPPYSVPAGQYTPSVDSGFADRSQSVASSSRFTEPPSSPIRSRSRTSSIEEAPEDESESCEGSRIPAMRSNSVAYYGLSHIGVGSSGHSSERDNRSRSHSRFSLGKVVHAIEAVKDRMRSQSPRAQSRSQWDDQQERGRPTTKGKGKPQVGPCDVHASLETEITEPSMAGGEGDGGWVVFPEGTYTYPVFFTIPNNSPPTMKADHGSLIWKVKAEVERPGVLQLNMTTEKEVIVVSVPKDDDTEEAGVIDLHQKWEEQLHYHVQIMGRGISVGGKIPFQLTMMSLAKIKLHFILAYLDERTEYYTQTQSRARPGTIRRATLLVIRHDDSDYKRSIPILPLTSDEPDAFQKSPLYRFLRPGDDESEVASSLMGPGPWTIRHQLSVPDSCSILHPSNQAKRSNVIVSHTLKLVLRVERDEESITTGKKKLYDIVVNVPVQVLSCRCSSEWTSLPCYDEAPRSVGDTPEDTLMCPCHTRNQAKARTPSHAPSTRSPGSERDALPPTTNSNSFGAPNMFPSNSLSSCTELHERLMSGLVSETGEAPPSYERFEAIYS